MNNKPDKNWIPEHDCTAEGEQRRVGVEIELAGVEPIKMAESIKHHFGGKIEEHTLLEFSISDTKFGEFILELDASSLKSLAEKQAEHFPDKNSLVGMTSELLAKAAEQLVPWEVVSPPISIHELSSLEAFIADLREQGALGTRHALYYAFGVHLNPELPDLSADVIVNYLRAYFCLYDWISENERIDTARKISPYINHFEKDFILLITDPDYSPGQPQLIDDYLTHNPTRNRSLDMLPLFAHLDEDRVRSTIDDSRIKARPTFHYRLPNCDIDNPDWNLYASWSSWLAVETLAWQPDKLKTVCEEYRSEVSRLTHPIERRWVLRTKELLQSE